MTIEEVICARLLAISPVTNLVGQRVYLQVLPQRGTLPAIRVQEIGEISTGDHHRGVTNLRRTRIQVDVYAAVSSGADHYTSAAAIADAIDGNWLTGSPPNGLSGWRGMAGGSPATVEVLYIERVDRRAEFEGEELQEQRIRQDFMVHWRRM